MAAKKITIIFVCLGLIILAGLLVSNFLKDKKQTEQPEESKLLSPQSAAQIALEKAKLWHADATLANSKSTATKTDEFGYADDWEFMFVSESAKNKGYRILMTNRNIIESKEVPYTGKG